MGQKQQDELFSVRLRIRRWKSVAGVSHLITVAVLVLCSLWMLPRLGAKSAFELNQEVQETQRLRQLLVEAMDRYARYEKYYNEIYGRYTRDLTRLTFPARLSNGTLDELKEHYEISVEEAGPNRFLLIATGLKGPDRLTIDESHRLSANFVLPPPSRSYLMEEANRILKLQMQGEKVVDGAYSRYWQIFPPSEEQSWVAVGVRNPVMGEKVEPDPTREIASIFANVSDQVKSRMGLGAKVQAPPQPLQAFPVVNSIKEQLSSKDVSEWMEAARLAQHIHRRERGAFARKWEDLDYVSDFKFSERIRLAKNIRVHPIELGGDRRSFRLVMEGTSGDLMGEQFVMDESGSFRQVRYTEALIQQLQETTNLLENAFNFQINPVSDDNPQKQPRP